jgi:hypothetical protein
VNDLQAASLAALTALTSLTELRFCEPDETACQVLAQLTQLRELVLYDPGRITRAGFRALTSLTRLTFLGFAPSSGGSPPGLAPFGFTATEVARSAQNMMDEELLCYGVGLEGGEVKPTGTVSTAAGCGQH